MQVERKESRRWRRAIGVDMIENESASNRVSDCKSVVISASLLTYLCSSKMYSASMALMLIYLALTTLVLIGA